MVYDIKSAIGDSGEHYFAYWIAKNFNFPCRLLDIDLGIDAQIEILDKDNFTTGDFVAVQIKSTTNSKKNGESITQNNLLYWRDISEKYPVILVFIDLIKYEIYWKHMDSDLIDYYLNNIKNKNIKNPTIKIVFNKTTEKLDQKDKEKIAILPYKSSLTIMNAKLSEISDSVKLFKNFLTNNTNELDYYHFANNISLKDINVIKVLDSFTTAYESLDTINSEINKLGRFPQKLNNICNKAEEQIQWLEAILFDLMFEYLVRNEYLILKDFKKIRHIAILNLFNRVMSSFSKEYNVLPSIFVEDYFTN